MNVYRVLDTSNWPPTVVERQEVIDRLYSEMQQREQQELDRMAQVMDLITGKACFSRTLAERFGDALPGNSQECGHCELGITWRLA